MNLNRNIFSPCLWLEFNRMIQSPSKSGVLGVQAVGLAQPKAIINNS